MDWIPFFGYFGSFLTSITFIPQVYKAWQTKSVGDLSVWMMLIVVLSTLVWLAYGFGINSGPVIVANAIVFDLVLHRRIRFQKDGKEFPPVCEYRVNLESSTYQSSHLLKN